MSIIIPNVGKGGIIEMVECKNCKSVDATIRNWIPEAANSLPEIKVSEEITEMEFDEMWHYIGKKTKAVGHQGS